MVGRLGRLLDSDFDVGCQVELPGLHEADFAAVVEKIEEEKQEEGDREDEAGEGDERAAEPAEEGQEEQEEGDPATDKPPSEQMFYRRQSMTAFPSVEAFAGPL